ncbi:Ger(x)C family spore germination protein [Clostridium neuense]|uniref:Ger(X)C family spore germination protein n=1 Tax=Clostridium neuense TaxID=1728934 RepID=A0ABW8TLF4_9CLOT
MKKYMSLVMKIVICILMALNLTACRSARELNKIAIVMGVGVDKGKQPDEVETTVQIAKVAGSKGMSKSGGSPGGGVDYLNLKETGQSISEAVKAFNRKLNRQLFFSHNQIVVFGDGAAANGIERYMDFFLRHRETRLLVWILVAKGPASEILNMEPAIESTPAISIGELVKNEQNVSQIPAVTLKDFAARLMSKTTAPVAPMVQRSKKDDKGLLYLSETAVFKKDKMIGTLNKQETRGLLWGIDKVRNGVVVVSMENGRENVNVLTTHANSKIKAKIKAGIPYITIEIKQEGDLQEQTSSKDLSDPKAFASIERLEAEVIRKEVLAALRKSQELNADIFGFGDIIYKHYPNEWNKLEGEWNKVFKNIHVDVSVDARLRRTGRITKPIMSKEQ